MTYPPTGDSTSASADADARYRWIVEAAAEGIWELDAGGRTTFVNARMAAMLGYTPDEMLGLAATAFLEEEQHPAVADVLARHRMGSTERMELRYSCKDGSAMWARVSAVPHLDADGRYVGSTAMVTDLTEHRRDREALRQSEERYRAVVEQSVDGIVIVQNTTIVYANRAYAALMGLADPARVVGTTVGEFVVPKHQRAALVARAMARERGEATADRYEVSLLGADGVLRTVETSATAITHEGRRASLGVVRDVTDRARVAAEREDLLTREQAARKIAAREAAEKSAILEQMGDAVLVVGADERVILANPAAVRFFGADQPAVVGMRATAARGLADGATPWEIFGADGQVIPPEDRQLARALRGEAAAAEQRTVHSDGRERWSWATATPLRGDDGSVNGAVLVIRDTTERRAAEETATRSEKLNLLGRMAGGVAHDLNQSLALVAGYADLLGTALAQPAPDIAAARAMLDTVAQAAMDGGAAVQRLLVFTRDRDEGPPERVDLARVLHDVARLTAPRWRDAAQADGRPISLVVDAPAHAAALGHPALLRQALTNLVINAADALPRGGAIKLSARSRGDTVEVTVADTGLGMDEDVRRRAFEPFYSTKGERGTGLGLSQVAAIVEKHGGSATLRSAPGDGTTVTIVLPAAMTAGDAPSVAAEPPAPARSLRVLVVDDDPHLARLAKTMLGGAGHAATTAASGEEALARLAVEPYDLVVTDLSMGVGMNGWEFATRVHERWPAARIVLATGWGAGIDAAEARSRGVDAVLAKPYRVDDLMAVIRGG